MTPRTVVVGPATDLSGRLLDELDALEAEGVVIVFGSDPESGPLDALGSAGWDHLVDAPMWNALIELQGARASFHGRGGRIVLVVPTIGLAGAERLVPYTTAVEGIRAMAKSAARQWHTDGIIVNVAAAPLHLFAPGLNTAAAHMSAPACQDDSALVRSVVEAVRFLLTPGIDHLVGETVIVDGGSVMLP